MNISSFVIFELIASDCPAATFPNSKAEANAATAFQLFRFSKDMGNGMLRFNWSL
ncbi:MAG: hypothetical protein R2825_14815 [Saprospiraceae bacterium]